MVEEFPLYGIGMVNLVHDSHVDFLPEARYCRHTGRVGLTHGLLYLQRICVDNHSGTLGQAENSPAALEDMRVGQEVHHTVFLGNGYASAIGVKGCMELTVGQDDTLGVARSATGVEDVGNIVEGCFLL